MATVSIQCARRRRRVVVVVSMKEQQPTGICGGLNGNWFMHDLCYLGLLKAQSYREY